MENNLNAKNIKVKRNQISNTLLKSYKNQCQILQMFSIPYFGTYDSEYNFINPILCLENKTIPNHLPKHINQKITKTLNKYNIPFNFFHITADASSIYNKSNQRIIGCNEVRLNLVPHSFIFQELKGKLTSDYQISVFPSLFLYKSDYDIIKETEEKDNLKINPKCELYEKELERTIILHRTREGIPAISPNNISVLFNLNCQLIHFYIVILGTNRGKISNGCFCEYIIMPNAFNCRLFMEMSLSFMNAINVENILENIYKSKMIYNDNFKNVIEYFLYEIICKYKENRNVAIIKDWFKEFFIKGFNNIFDFGDNGLDDEISHQNDIDNMSEFYYNYLLTFIAKLFGDEELKVENYAIDIINCSLKDYYIVDIIEKFINFHISRINIIFNSYQHYLEYFKLFDSIKEKSRAEYINNVWPNLEEFICSLLGISVSEFEKKTKEINSQKKNTNKNIEEFYKISNNLLNNGKITKNEMNKIDFPFLNFLYYEVWESRGKIKGVHKDFGKYSFNQDYTISICYHCQNDERYELLINMAQKIESADSKYVNIEDL